MHTAISNENRNKRMYEFVTQFYWYISGSGDWRKKSFSDFFPKSAQQQWLSSTGTMMDADMESKEDKKKMPKVAKVKIGRMWMILSSH